LGIWGHKRHANEQEMTELLLCDYVTAIQGEASKLHAYFKYFTNNSVLSYN
jgi:hypothetical protein